MLGKPHSLTDNAATHTLNSTNVDATNDVGVPYHEALLQSSALQKTTANNESPPEHQQAAELLQHNLDTFAHLIQNAPFGVYVVDAQFCLRQVSAASRKMFGSVRPLIGRDFNEVIRTIWAEPFASETLGHFRHTLTTGEPYAAPNTIAHRQDSAAVEAYDWKIERISLPDGQFAVVGYFYDLTERNLAEQALRESEEFNRSIIESSPDCIKVLDLEGNLLSMQSGQQLLGIEDIRPFLNKSWFDFWLGDDREAARAAVDTALSGKAGKFIGFFRTLRGEPKWWDVALSPIRDATGKPARLLAVSRDVTEQRCAEMNVAWLASVSMDLLRLSSVKETMQIVGAKLASFLNLSLCAFVEINEAADQVVIAHDWHREDVPGLVGVYRLADFVEAEFIQVARTGESIIVRDTAKDPRTTPEKFDALKIASFICVPLVRDGQWRFALCLYKSEPYDWREDEIALARELTVRIWTRLERLRAEEAMRVSEARYRMLFDSIDEGFCVIEMMFDAHDKPIDYRFLEVNPTFEKQTGLHGAAGKRMRELVPNLEATWYEIYGKVALTGEAIRFVNEAKALDGRWFDVYACRIGKPEGRKVAIVYNDITERRLFELNLGQAKAVAEKANLAKSDFLSSMSHELRSPLNAILGFAQLLESDAASQTASQKESTGYILQAGWYLLAMIDEILDLSMIESGKLLLALESVSLQAVLLDCQAMIEPQAQKRNIRVSFPRIDPLFCVNGDRTRMKQVLINLLSNAIKYNKVNGTVVVDYIQISPERIRIRVSDQGTGLSTEQLAQLFQPFNRLGKETGSEEGTGIGLVTTKRLVELMGGSIGVESTVGVGSVFWVELTRAEDSQLVDDAIVIEPLLFGQTQHHAALRTLLHVEDDPANLKLVEKLIARRPNMRLLSAGDAATGIALARKYIPDVILMDINLPGISGVAALKILREDPLTMHIPIVAVSANAMPHDILKGLEDGFFCYLTKPIKVNEFMNAVDAAVEFSRAAANSATITGAA